MSPEIKDIKEYMKELRDELRGEIKLNTELTRTGFEKMNGRVKKLELKEAVRQGREGLSSGGDMTWKKMSFALIGILSAGMTLGLVIAQGIFK